MNSNSEERYLGFIKRQHFRYYLAAFVSLITFIIYLKSLQNEFVEWDDITYVVDNPYIRSLNPAFFRWAFLDFHAGNWHPLTWISHAIDYALWGLNPLGHHLANIILHSINTFIVVLLAIKLLEVSKGSTINSGLSSFLNEQALFMTGGATGILFGLHPLHVESVTWVAERKDLLCGLFFLLSIKAYAKYASAIMNNRAQINTGSRFLNRHYLFTLGMFILALLSKPMAVSLPLVLLILDWYPFKRIESLKSAQDAFIEKVPFFVLSLGSSLLTILAQRSGHAIASMEVVPLPTRALVASKSLIAYLWKMIVPLNLIPFYAYPKDVSLLSAEYLLPIALVVGITISSIVLAKKQRLWLSAWMYYIITLIPVLGIVQVGGQSMADRYTYLPSLGLFLVAGMLVGWVTTKVNPLTKGRVMVQFFSVVIASSAFIAMSYLTLGQIGVWKNSFELWNFVIDKDIKNPFPYCGRGAAFHRMGYFDRAIADYDKAIALDPFFDKAYYDRGLVFKKIGQLDRAIADYNMAIALSAARSETSNTQETAKIHYNLGVVYEDQGRIDEAINEYQKAINLDHGYHKVHNNLGAIYAKQGRIDEAINEYQTELRLNPYNAEAHHNLGVAYLGQDQTDEAISEFKAALMINPNLPVTRQFLEYLLRNK